MTEEQARKILGAMIKPDGAITFLTDSEEDGILYVWSEANEQDVDLEGCFTVEQLEAIAWWIKNRRAS